MCGAAIPSEHAHLIDTVGRRLLCACRACVATARRGDGALRVPKRRVTALPGFCMTDAQWDALQLPIDLAFLFYSSPEGRSIALYPGPAGATESLLSLDGWAELVAANPALDALEPDVEALLVNRTGRRRDTYVVPVDRCYALVGTIRRQWRGLSGGSEVWEAVDAFFAGLQREAVVG